METRIENALQGKEVVIDITTVGRNSGEPRRIEIWFHGIDGKIIIAGSPGPRNWFANLLANPKMTLHLKGGLQADLPGTARIISDTAERRAIMSAPETIWYREYVGGIEPLLKGSPMIEMILDS